MSMRRFWVLLFILFLAPNVNASSHEANITIFIEGTIGLGISGDCVIPKACSDVGSDNPYEIKLGDEAGCLINIENKANIRDVISMTSRIANSDPTDHEGWIRFEYTCVETIGECNGTQVTNMQIDPEVVNTSVFLGLKGFKLSSGDPTLIEIRGFSNTNFTVEQLGCVKVDVQPQQGGFNPLEAPLFESPIVVAFAIAIAGITYHLANKGKII